ncbi:MAG TPA: chromate transporter, partial [Acidimicrobiales bacterium]|nr:chromate transporter [Acidimicrobiales bacterium]
MPADHEPADPGSPPHPSPRPAGLGTIARQWGRLGVIGFGGPPAHIALLRKLCVDRRGWISGSEFEDGLAATSLLPGPTSTQMAIFCAWRAGGPAGGLLGGLCFIAPGLVLILALSAVFFARQTPLWVHGAAAGAGAAVPAVALAAAIALLPDSWRRGAGSTPRRARWALYVGAGAVGGALVGEYLVFLLAAAGLVEVASTGGFRRPPAAAPVA